MKTSASEPSGDEVEQNAGCKTVRELYFFQYLKKKNVSLVHTVIICSLKLSLSVTLQGWVLYPQTVKYRQLNPIAYYIIGLVSYILHLAKVVDKVQYSAFKLKRVLEGNLQRHAEQYSAMIHCTQQGALSNFLFGFCSLKMY